VTVEFGPEQDQLLERLAKSHGITKAAILRFGLSLLVIAENEGRRGNAIGVVSGERVVKEIAGLWNVTAAMPA
jgi:hypothetical protein